MSTPHGWRVGYHYYPRRPENSEAVPAPSMDALLALWDAVTAAGLVHPDVLRRINSATGKCWSEQEGARLDHQRRDCDA